METLSLLMGREWFWLMLFHRGQELMEMLTLMMTKNGQRIHQVSYTSLRMILVCFIVGKGPAEYIAVLTVIENMFDV